MYANALLSTLRFLNSSETSHNNNKKVSTLLFVCQFAVIVSAFLSSKNNVPMLYVALACCAFVLSSRFNRPGNSTKDCVLVVLISCLFLLSTEPAILNLGQLGPSLINLALLAVIYQRMAFIHEVAKRVVEKSTPGYQMELGL